MKIADWPFVWLWLMGGPIIPTACGITNLFPVINLGWLGLLLIPAHPVRPCKATGCMTLFGLALWFFAGFLALMVVASVGLIVAAFAG